MTTDDPGDEPLHEETAIIPDRMHERTAPLEIEVWINEIGSVLDGKFLFPGISGYTKKRFKEITTK